MNSTSPPPMTKRARRKAVSIQRARDRVAYLTHEAAVNLENRKHRGTYRICQDWREQAMATQHLELLTGEVVLPATESELLELQTQTRAVMRELRRKYRNRTISGHIEKPFRVEQQREDMFALGRAEQYYADISQRLDQVRKKKETSGKCTRHVRIKRLPYWEREMVDYLCTCLNRSKNFPIETAFPDVYPPLNDDRRAVGMRFYNRRRINGVLHVIVHFFVWNYGELRPDEEWTGDNEIDIARKVIAAEPARMVDVVKIKEAHDERYRKYRAQFA